MCALEETDLILRACQALHWTNSDIAARKLWSTEGEFCFRSASILIVRFRSCSQRLSMAIPTMSSRVRLRQNVSFRMFVSSSLQRWQLDQHHAESQRLETCAELLACFHIHMLCCRFCCSCHLVLGAVNRSHDALCKQQRERALLLVCLVGALIGARLQVAPNYESAELPHHL